MKLIPDWRLAWRFLSVQAAALLAVLSAIQGELLPLVQPLVPSDLWPWVSVVLSMAIIALRILAQDSLEPARERIEWEREQLELDAFEARLQAADLRQRQQEIQRRNTYAPGDPAAPAERAE